MAEAKLPIATAESAGTPYPFCAIARAYIKATVFLLRSGETLHFESLLKFVQREPVQDSLVQRMQSFSTHAKPSSYDVNDTGIDGAERAALGCTHSAITCAQIRTA